jgi:hypothetical protein
VHRRNQVRSAYYFAALPGLDAPGTATPEPGIDLPDGSPK